MKAALLFVGLLFLQATAMISAEENEFTPPDPFLRKGVPTKYGHLPFMAFIDSADVPCSAVIISHSWVLTAASCIKYPKENQITVRVGSDDRAVGGLLYQVNATKVHPKYKCLFGIFVYNVGLVRVVGKFFNTNNVNIEPISLPTKRHWEYNGLVGTVAGWGGGFDEGFDRDATEVLRSRNLTIDISKNILTDDFNINDNHWACKTSGDCGEPLAVFEENKWVLVGIEAQMRCSSSISFQSIYNHLGFIYQHVKDLNTKLPPNYLD